MQVDEPSRAQKTIKIATRFNTARSSRVNNQIGGSVGGRDITRPKHRSPKILETIGRYGLAHLSVALGHELDDTCSVNREPVIFESANSIGSVSRTLYSCGCFLQKLRRRIAQVRSFCDASTENARIPSCRECPTEWRPGVLFRNNLLASPKRSSRSFGRWSAHTKVCLEEEDSSVDSIRTRGWQFADSRLGNHVAAVHVRLGRVVGGGGARCGVTPKGPSNSPVLHPIASAKQRGRRCNGR